MKAAKSFQRTIEKLCKEHGFDITKAGELTIGQNEYDNGSAFMPIFIQNNGQGFIRVAHYYIQNGDSMADPEYWFWIGGDGGWYPQEFTMSAFGRKQEIISGDWTSGQFKPKSFSPYFQNDAVSFCHTWGQNIRWQQNGHSSTFSYYYEREEMPEPDPQPTISLEDKLARLRMIAAKLGQRAAHFDNVNNPEKAAQYRTYRVRAFTLQNKLRKQLYQDKAA